MGMNLFDSELKVMEVLWREGDVSAGHIAKILREEVGWNRNTTYTIIKKCIEKGAAQRFEPKFMCKALITRKEVQTEKTEELIAKMFSGSKLSFFTQFLSPETLTQEELRQLKQIVDGME